MEEEFIRQWFAGFSAGLDRMTQEDLGNVLAPCAKACADSYPLAKFREAKDKSTSLTTFVASVVEAMPGVAAEADEEKRSLVFRYPRCYCDLYLQNLVTTPRLCECSRQNLLYIMGELFPGYEADVRLLKSVIAGDDNCELSVTFSGDVFS